MTAARRVTIDGKMPKRGVNTGARLEEEVEHYLQEILIPDLLGLSRERTAVFRHRAYYSSARGSDIIFDLAIELTLKGAAAPFLIWLWECKDYAGPVGVEDIEEFDAKIRQVSDHNTKGTLVSRNGFRRGAIALAKARGIGIIRFRDGTPIIIGHAGSVQRRTADEEALEALTQDDGSEYRVSGISIEGVPIATTYDLRILLAHQLGEFVQRPPSAACEICGERNGVQRRLLLNFLRSNQVDIPHIRAHGLCDSCFALINDDNPSLVSLIPVMIFATALFATVISVIISVGELIISLFKGDLVWPMFTWPMLGAGLLATIGFGLLQRKKIQDEKALAERWCQAHSASYARISHGHVRYLLLQEQALGTQFDKLSTWSASKTVLA